MSPFTKDEAVTGWSLADHSQAELAELFATLSPATTEEMTGEWFGELVGVTGLERLPRPIRNLVHSGVLAPVAPWQGKRFSGSTGANIWGTSARNRDWMRFRSVSMEHSPVDGLPALWLDYDVAENLRPLRAIRGELRRLDSHTVLGRMNWQSRSKLQCLLYFPMRRNG